MRKLTLLLGLFVAMILGLLFAASKDDGTLTEQDNSKLEQSQKVSEKGKFLQTRHRFVNTGAFKEPKKGDPVDMVYEFFELNQEEFGVTNPREELVYQGTQGSKKNGIEWIDFGQVYKGVRVQNRGIRVHFSPSGDLQSISSDFYYDIDLSPIPQIDSFTAWQVALIDLGSPKNAKVVNREYRSEFFKAESLMFEQGGVTHPDYNARFEGVATHLLIWRSEQSRKYHLVWKVCVDPKAPRQVAPMQLLGYYIDAHDRTVLHKGESYSRSYIEKWGH